MSATTTHYLSPFTVNAPMCGGPDRGPLDLTPYNGRVSCGRCHWAFALLAAPWMPAAHWLIDRGDTVRLRGADST